MKKLSKLFKCFDIYGAAVKLNIKQKEKVQTIWGALLTLLAIALLIVFTLGYGNDLLNFYTEDVQLARRPFYTLNKQNFPVAVAFQTYDQQTYNLPQYFRFEAMNVKTFNQNSSTIVETYEYEECKDSHFPELSSEY